MPNHTDSSSHNSEHVSSIKSRKAGVKQPAKKKSTIKPLAEPHGSAAMDKKPNQSKVKLKQKTADNDSSIDKSAFSKQTEGHDTQKIKSKTAKVEESKSSVKARKSAKTVKQDVLIPQSKTSSFWSLVQPIDDPLVHESTSVWGANVSVHSIGQRPSAPGKLSARVERIIKSARTQTVPSDCLAVTSDSCGKPLNQASCQTDCDSRPQKKAQIRTSKISLLCEKFEQSCSMDYPSVYVDDHTYPTTMSDTEKQFSNGDVLDFSSSAATVTNLDSLNINGDKMEVVVPCIMPHFEVSCPRPTKLDCATPEDPKASNVLESSAIVNLEASVGSFLSSASQLSTPPHTLETLFSSLTLMQNSMCNLTSLVKTFAGDDRTCTQCTRSNVGVSAICETSDVGTSPEAIAPYLLYGSIHNSPSVHGIYEISDSEYSESSFSDSLNYQCSHVKMTCNAMPCLSTNGRADDVSDVSTTLPKAFNRTKRSFITPSTAFMHSSPRDFSLDINDIVEHLAPPETMMDHSVLERSRMVITEISEIGEMCEASNDEIFDCKSTVATFSDVISRINVQPEGKHEKSTPPAIQKPLHKRSSTTYTTESVTGAEVKPESNYASSLPTYGKPVLTCIASCSEGSSSCVVEKKKELTSFPTNIEKPSFQSTNTGSRKMSALTIANYTDGTNCSNSLPRNSNAVAQSSRTSVDLQVHSANGQKRSSLSMISKNRDVLLSTAINSSTDDCQHLQNESSDKLSKFKEQHDQPKTFVSNSIADDSGSTTTAPNSQTRCSNDDETMSTCSQESSQLGPIVLPLKEKKRKSLKEKLSRVFGHKPKTKPGDSRSFSQYTKKADELDVDSLFSKLPPPSKPKQMTKSSMKAKTIAPSCTTLDSCDSIPQSVAPAPPKSKFSLKRMLRGSQTTIKTNASSHCDGQGGSDTEGSIFNFSVVMETVPEATVTHIT